jgi:pSer/pThr/pTyr-binding forkhead associated (FHA) protein
MRELPPGLRSVTPAELAERLHAERGGEPFVVYVDGEGRQRIVALGSEAGALSIGRGGSSDVALAWDDEVSRVHAILERVGGEWTVVDDGLSRNGTYIGGERVHGRRRLRDGDVIHVGTTLLAFVAPLQEELRATDTTRRTLPPELSAAQRRVLQALCRPFAESAVVVPPSNREIADELVVSVDTVKTHLRALFELFGVPDMPQNRKRAELARRAFEWGVVPA